MQSELEEFLLAQAPAMAWKAEISGPCMTMSGSHNSRWAVGAVVITRMGTGKLWVQCGPVLWTCDGEGAEFARAMMEAAPAAWTKATLATLTEEI